MRREQTPPSATRLHMLGKYAPSLIGEVPRRGAPPDYIGDARPGPSDICNAVRERHSLGAVMRRTHRLQVRCRSRAEAVHAPAGSARARRRLVIAALRLDRERARDMQALAHAARKCEGNWAMPFSPHVSTCDDRRPPACGTLRTRSAKRTSLRREKHGSSARRVWKRT